MNMWVSVSSGTVDCLEEDLDEGRAGRSSMAEGVGQGREA